MEREKDGGRGDREREIFTEREIVYFVDIVYKGLKGKDQRS